MGRGRPALPRTLHELPGDGTFLPWEVQGDVGAWLCLGVSCSLRPALQGGSCTLHPQAGYQHPLPQQSHFGRIKTCPCSQVSVLAAPRPHPSPHAALLDAPAEATDGLSDLLGPSWGCGAGQGAMAPPGGAQSPVAALTQFSILCTLQSSADCTAVRRRLKSRLRLKS